MSRQKRRKFAENALRDNVIEPGKDTFGKLKGVWGKRYFKNENPITLELACGRGEYSVGLGRKFPERNFIGIDVKGDRIWKGSGISLDEGLDNVAFLREQIQFLQEHFENSEVGDIWIVFPDPRPKDREEKHRLTHPRYLDIYRELIIRDGWIRLKTDNTGLFEYSIEILQARNDIRDLVYTDDLYGSEFSGESHDIVTRYERKFHTSENKIKYLRFRFV